MLTVGDQFPNFSLQANVSTQLENAFTTINHDSYPNQWKIYFFWPKDFTFVCPTEILAFSALQSKLAIRETVLLGGSIDSEYVHLAWRKGDAELKTVEFPFLADIKRELSLALGILDKTDGVCQQATFIVDPQNTIRFVSVTDSSVGRNTDEVLRVLDALQTDALCGCNWQKGDETIQVS